MKITKFETIPVRVPIRPELAITSSLGSHTDSPFLLLKVHTDEGLIGLGEVSATPRWSGEDNATAHRVIHEYLAPALTGQNPLDIEAAVKRMNRVLAANPFTKSGVEMALWDILGKSCGLPLYRLLGGAVRDVVPLKFSISGASPERASWLANWAAERGFKTMKVKVAMGSGDLERVKAVREAIGPNVRRAWTPMADGQRGKQFRRCEAWTATRYFLPNSQCRRWISAGWRTCGGRSPCQ